MKIKFDSDSKTQKGGKLTKAQRSEYVVLCNQLVSRDPSLAYIEITARLMYFLRNDAFEKIEKLKTANLIDEIKKGQMISDLTYIFSKTDMTDENFIGRLNIVSLQCVILFTENCIGPLAKKFEVGLNNSFQYYNVLKSGDWKNYQVMKSTLTKKNSGSFFQLYSYSKEKPYTTSTPSNRLIFLITIIDYLSVDEIITSFLDNVVICGISSNFIYADGRYLTPFEFVEHDITHGGNYYYTCFERSGLSKSDLVSFYQFCKNTISDKSKLYSIKFMVFLLIHESFCDFFPTEHSPIKLKANVLSSILHTAILRMDRYLNNNDLGLSIPKDYRDSEEKIKQYLDLSTEVYLRELDNWGTERKSTTTSISSGGKKTKTIQKKPKRAKNKAHRQTKYSTKKNNRNRIF
jgi:hypothetical protein